MGQARSDEPPKGNVPAIHPTCHHHLVFPSSFLMRLFRFVLPHPPQHPSLAFPTWGDRSRSVQSAFIKPPQRTANGRSVSRHCSTFCYRAVKPWSSGSSLPSPRMFLIVGLFPLASGRRSHVVHCICYDTTVACLKTLPVPAILHVAARTRRPRPPALD
jgi:hypothetical protein